MAFGDKVLVINCLVFLGCSFLMVLFGLGGPERSGSSLIWLFLDFASRIAIGIVPRSDWIFSHGVPIVFGVKVLIINCLVFLGCSPR